LSLSMHEGHVPPIVKTVAASDQGVDEVLSAVRSFREWAASSGVFARKRREHLDRLLSSTITSSLLARVGAALPAAERASLLDRMASRELDPYAAASLVLSRMGMS
jgi:LAO/AO transport system kinase